MKNYFVSVLYFATAICVGGCGNGNRVPDHHELERRDIISFTKDVSPYTGSISSGLKHISWAKKSKRRVKKGKTWLFYSRDGVIAFDSMLTYYLPDKLRGHNLAEVNTVVLVKSVPEIVGYYGSENGSSHVDAVQYHRSILFVDAETMKIVKEIADEGGSPPTQISYREGNKPQQVSGGSYSLEEIVAVLQDNLL